jgi:predicted phosphodiesterase
MTEKLVFVHLSDIHFTRSSGTVHDLDKNVRNELRLDAIKVSKEIGPVTGVLVTGDIAFSGSKDEYKHAAEWLSEFCKAIGCPEENVWVVPGNHDVDRKLANRKVTRTLHQNIRKDDAAVDSELREIFSDAQSANALLEPLTEYNAFAARFQCSLSPEKHYWERDLCLSCGTIVRLRGLTSALVSNAEDKRTNVVLGTAQAGVSRAPGVLHLTLCHHPPDWLRDKDAVDDHLKSKVHIQLFGHKHAQRVDNINGKVRLVAGAMHPDRREPEWLPTYNFLEITRKDNEHIALRLFQRRWYQPHTCFVADRDHSDGKEHREFHWAGFPRTVRKEHSDAPPLNMTNTESVALDAVTVTTMAKDGNVTPPPDYMRRLWFRFVTLPFRKQFDIAKSLDLLTDDDGALSDEALFREVFKRVKKKDLLARLWQETENHHEDPANFNPFEKSK